MRGHGGSCCCVASSKGQLAGWCQPALPCVVVVVVVAVFAVVFVVVVMAAVVALWQMRMRLVARAPVVCSASFRSYNSPHAVK